MKTIFIVTDFSSASHNASKYGVELASALGAKIVLFHAYTIPLSIPESYVIVSPEDVRKTAEDYLLEEVMSLRKSTVQSIEIIAEEGPATDSIIKHAMQFANCFIVAGMKGEGGVIKRTFGSTVSGLARKLTQPMIVVPEAATFKSIERLAIATEMDVYTDMHAFEWIKEIGGAFKSKVYIIRVLKSNTSIVEELSHRSHRLFNLLKPLEIEYKFPRNEDVTIALQDFSLDNNVDLIAVVPHHHTIMERIFIKSETRQLIFHTHIPLLILPEKTLLPKENQQKLQKQFS